MKKILFTLLFGLIGLVSCSTVESTVIKGENILNYYYLVWESNIQNNDALEYINFDIYDALKSSSLKIIPRDSLNSNIVNKTLIAQCHISSEKYLNNSAFVYGQIAGASSNLKEKLFISVNFKNAETNLPVFYVKSNNIDDDEISSLKRRIKTLLKFGNIYGIDENKIYNK